MNFNPATITGVRPARTPVRPVAVPRVSQSAPPPPRRSTKRSAPPSGTGWNPRVELTLVVGSAVVAGIELAILNAWAFAHIAFHDGGIIVYGAERMASGQLPYRDFFHFFSPGSITALAALYGLLGVSVWTTLVCVVLLAAGMAAAVAVLSRAAGLPPMWAAGAAWLAVNAGIVWWPTPSHHWFATLVGVAGVAASAWALRLSSRRWAFAAGLILASVIWFIQPRGILLLLVVGGTLGLLRRDLIKPLIAGAAVAGLAVVPLLIMIPFDPLWQQLVMFPLKHYPSVNQAPLFLHDLYPAAAEIDSPRKVLQVILELGWVWLTVPVLAAALVLAYRRRQAVLALLVAGAAAAFISVMYRATAGHISFVAPLLVVPMVLVAHSAATRWKRARALVVVVAALHFVVFLPVQEGWLVLSGQTAAAELPRGSVPIGTVEERADSSDNFVFALAYVRDRTAPGEAIFAYPAIPSTYFLIDRPNATSFDYLWPGENTADQFAQAINQLRIRQPRYVVRDLSVGNWSLSPTATIGLESARSMDLALDELYEQVLYAEPFQVLQLR